MNKSLKELTQKQQQALPYFVNTPSIIEACKKAGITPKTYYVWVNTTPFKEVLEQERAKLREESYQILKASLPRAAETLVALLSAENESVKRMAANDILTHVNTYFEVKEVEERLTKLEQRS